MLTKYKSELPWRAALLTLLGACGLLSCVSSGSTLYPRDMDRYEAAVFACAKADASTLAASLTEIDWALTLAERFFMFKNVASTYKMRVVAARRAGNDQALAETLEMGRALYLRQVASWANSEYLALLRAWKQGPDWDYPHPIKDPSILPKSLVFLPSDLALAVNRAYYDAMLQPARDWTLPEFARADALWVDLATFKGTGELALAELSAAYLARPELYDLALRYYYMDDERSRQERASALMERIGAAPSELASDKSRIRAVELLQKAEKDDRARVLLTRGGKQDQTAVARLDERVAEEAVDTAVAELRQAFVRIRPPTVGGSWRLDRAQRQFQYALEWYPSFEASWKKLSPEHKKLYQSTYYSLRLEYSKVLLEHPESALEYIKFVTKKMDQIQTARQRGERVSQSDYDIVDYGTSMIGEIEQFTKDSARTIQRMLDSWKE